ncbi:MAG: copper-translocating P-type ATPase [Blastopirellula sp.]|nr:MAG: copper-translocating P-type ATPase [Blastopirellula sp.]
MCDTDHDVRTCDYCGLPVGQLDTLRAGTAQADVPVYCCFGCRFAASVTSEQGDAAQSQWLMTRLGLAIFFTMNVMVLTLALWSWDVFAEQITSGGVRAEALFELLRYASLMLTTVILLLLGGPLVEKCVDDLMQRKLTTDLLLAVGVLAAFTYSAISVLQKGQHTYFEVCAMILVAVTLGRWLEAISKLKTTQVLRSMEKLLPETFRKLDQQNNEVETPIDELQRGDTFRVLPGERIVTDAVILQGTAAVDEQIVTGESHPKELAAADKVLGGSTCLDGELRLEATATVKEGTLKRLIDAVEQAALAKGTWQKTADRLSAWFLPGVMSIAAVTLVVHWSLFGFHAGLLSSLAVILIACPCALALATPMAVWVAMGHAAKQGVLLRNGDVIDRLAKSTQLMFDKTGTLTTGQAVVEQLVINERAASDEPALKSLFAAVALCSSHRLSTPIRNYCQTTEPGEPMQLLENIPGLGILASNAQESSPQKYLLGNVRLMRQSGLTLSESLQTTIEQAEQLGTPLVCLGNEQTVLGVLLFREELRPETSATLDWAQQNNFEPTILTGDHSVSRQITAQHPQVVVHAKLLPEDKLAVIRQQQATGASVIMIGDGINDAPSLTAADVGIAMGCGADISRDAADVCLMGSDLSKIPWVVSYSKEVSRTVRQNLTWAVAYNCIGILLAALGLLNPILAALAMLISSLIVIGNSLKLDNFCLSEEAEQRSASDTETIASLAASASTSPLSQGVIG